MTGALLSAALAVLLWPGPGAVRRLRAAEIREERAGGSNRWRQAADLPVPAVAAVVVGGVAAIASTPLVAVLGAAVGWLLGRVWSASRADRRSEQQVRGLTEALAVVSAELRSGRTLEFASETAARACPDADSGRALAAALRATTGAGPDHSDAGLWSALARIAAGAALSARTGSSLAGVLTAVEDDLRARSRQRVELRTATAGPRAGAAVLAGLPVLGLLMGSGVGADPWRVLTATPAGQVLLVAGVALETAGVWWSRRLVERALR